ncbi:UDP-glucose dehydrogenase family protein [Streptomyces indicus]|uniref:UDP-glucose 6-dehydrogenase n=1 Tax=Streptomyces indicus TaxID=417292 RepID=A0A1G9E0C2_9ACTN|nr:UDP-glucose/GDP-mannose dehydrogenase family protein [Streptomyces indicus]SDK69553.1 UDPglucose 6-dehydrogenase [Streptomyces indicus]
MRISVIGCGHLGAPHAAAMAELGHEVIGVELDPSTCKTLQSGRGPFYERGLDELLGAHVPTGRLRFTGDLREAAEFADLHFIAVGTPLSADGQGYDMGQVVDAVGSLAPLLTRPCTVVGKSTVTVGTVARLERILAEHAVEGVDLVWNPEFLREGHAVEDTLYPDRIVAGVSGAEAQKAIEAVYAPILARGDVELIVTDPATAEVIKSAANSFLATKISFINAMAEVCTLAGADVRSVAHAIGIDHRIGHAGMRPGIGYGGGCLPKDVRAFAHRLGEIGATRAVALLEAVEGVNRGRVEAAVALVEETLEGRVAGARIAFLGAAFKAGTSDIRNSPALELADRLRALGAQPVVYDPEALENARRAHPEHSYADTLDEALAGADVTVLATEWPQFSKEPGLPAAAARAVAAPRLVDIRTVVDPVDWTVAGWSVWQLGRPVRRPQA